MFTKASAFMGVVSLLSLIWVAELSGTQADANLATRDGVSAAHQTIGYPIAGEYQIVGVQVKRGDESVVTSHVDYGSLLLDLEGYLALLDDGTFELYVQMTYGERVLHDSITNGLWSRAGESVTLTTDQGMVSLSIEHTLQDQIILTTVNAQPLDNPELVGFVIEPLASEALTQS